MNALSNHKRLTYKAAFLFAGVIALSQSGIYAAQADGNSVSSVSSAACSDTSGYTVTLTGSFSSQIANVWVNGDIHVLPPDWSQTPTSLMVKIPASTAKTFAIQSYDGGPMLSADFLCTEAAVVVPPVDVAPVVTENGGTLPATATNNYNYLVAGLGLGLLGTFGLLRRKLVQN
jgi:LPXTG-motif cell wall-anchored protein